MKKIYPLIVAVLLSFTATAQNFEFGKFDNAELEMTRYDKDTSAHAVVLKEFGKTYISSNDGMPLVYEYHVKIKLFDSKGFDEGDVAVRLYHSDNNTFETVRDIKGITTYKDENGMVHQTELDAGKIYHENRDKHHELVKFALPNLRNGCVIEYTYITESPYRFAFHPWIFQWDIPKIYSEYEAHIPGIYEYNTVLRGYLKLTKNNADLERECFSYYGTKADCSKITYIETDIPAFIEEDYMTAPSNFRSAIYYELAAMTNSNGVKEKKTQEWKDIDYLLKHHEEFGDQIKRTGLLKDRIPANIMTITDTLEKAKTIYCYLQKWFKWNNTHTIFSDDGIKKALDGHNGNVADINLSLVAALNAVGINTDAVVLSTRENGIVNKLFPVVTDFDYVVARCTIGNQNYMLDATDPILAFGMLPERCINDQGRVISMTKPSYWIDMVQAPRRSTTTTINLNLQADGKIKGTVTTYSIGYAGYQKRKEIKNFNTTDEYVESIAGKLNGIKLLKGEVSGVDSLDASIEEKYDIEFTPDNTGEGLSFNPAFWKHQKSNPFKLNERLYPVDMGSASNNTMIVTLSYPDNYTVAEQPAPVGMALPNKGGKFITSVSNDNNTFSYSQIAQLSKAIYAPEEYPYLKELYNKIIQNQKAYIVLKKKL